MLGRLIASCFFVILSTLPASAFTDAETGLAVDLPQGRFAVSRAETAAPNDVAIDVELVGFDFPGTDQPGCQVTFLTIPANTALPQAQINEGMRRAVDISAGLLSGFLNVHSVELFDYAGIVGHEAITAPKGQDTLRARIVMLIMDTPRGRTSIICAGPTEELERLRDIARTVRDGVTPPS